MADAEEALRATERKANFQRLTRLLMYGGTRMLREKFDSIHPPTDLPLTLDDSATRDSLKKAKLFKAEWDCLYPSSGTFGKSTDFDITLIFRLFRTICNLTEPVTKWDKPPSSTDHSLEADLVRIKEYRNSVHAHHRTMEITGSEFRHLWKEISEALLRIAGSLSVAKRDEWKKAINKLLSDPLTPEAQRYVDELHIWYKNDMELKDAVEQLGDQVRQGNEDVRDQLQHFNDQLQQINQRLAIDYRIPLIVIVVTPSHLPMVATSAMAASSESMVTVPINEEKPQCDRQDPQTESYIWRVILSPALNRLQSVLDYFKVQLGVSTVDCTVGSLIITVTCNSIQILKGLWEDYSSGHLNTVIEQILVTPDVLEKLGLSELKLKTTISEEEYKKCKEFFLTEDKNNSSQEDNERGMREFLDEIKGERQQLDRQRRERKEREAVLQLRRELLNYNFHECPRIKKEAFKDLEVDDTDLIRIALIGPTGSGKTSLVGTLQRAIGEPQTAFEQGTGKEGSIILEEFYVQKNIRIVDTRGFFARDEKLYDEVLDIMTGRTRLGEEIKREYEVPVKQSRDGNQGPNTVARKPTAFSKHIHAVILVLKANDPRLEEGIYRGTLQRIRNHFQTHGVYPVTVITFLDMLTAEEHKKKASDEAGLATGGPGERTYFITNYTHENNEPSFAVERTALDILDSALISAESFIRIRKQQERNQMEREAMAGGASSGVVTVEQFFARLKKKHHWTDQGKTTAVLADLRRNEINTVKALKELWDDVKSELPLSEGMNKIMEEEIKAII